MKNTKKGFAPIALGATGKYVADAVRVYRQKRDLTYKELEKQLAALGRPIPELGLRRIEAEARRVDVDDLMALSVALGVSPVELLLHVPDELQSLVMNWDAVQAATGLPEDMHRAEAEAWVRGETELTLAERIEFWRRHVTELERSLKAQETHITELRTQLAHEREQENSSSGDAVLIKRLYWAEGDRTRLDRDLAFSQRELDALLEQAEQTEDDDDGK